MVLVKQWLLSSRDPRRRLFWRNNACFGGADSGVLLYSHQLPALRVSARVKYDPGVFLLFPLRAASVASRLRFY